MWARPMLEAELFPPGNQIVRCSLCQKVRDSLFVVTSLMQQSFRVCPRCKEAGLDATRRYLFAKGML